MMRFLRWGDRNLWSIPILVFLAAELALSVWSAASRTPVLLAAAPLAARQQVYSSLAGSSSGALAIVLAAVAILAAFGPRPDRTGRPSRAELSLAHARTIIAGSFLMASFFLLAAMITATVAEAVDLKHVGNGAVTTLLESSGIASVVGILVGGAGLALVIVERSRQ
jgi:hypothetical protein